jgi:hypothetical protein
MPDPTTTTIGKAKRDIKAGEVIQFTIRPDGLCESADIAFRKGLSFLDMTLLNDTTKENGNANGTKCNIWGK